MIAVRATILAAFVACFAAPAYAACLDPVADPGKIVFNQQFDVFQGCTARGWQAFHAIDGAGGPDPCAGSPAIGTQCSDGSYYAGQSPDGNVPMYVADADETGTYEWGSYGTSRGTTSSVTGRSNTDTLAGFGQAAHPAAYACETSTAHDHTDWYLPARDELNLLWIMIDTHGVTAGLDSSGSLYWSSSESTSNNARLQQFNTGGGGATGKTNSVLVRCVRR